MQGFIFSPVCPWSSEGVCQECCPGLGPWPDWDWSCPPLFRLLRAAPWEDPALASPLQLHSRLLQTGLRPRRRAQSLRSAGWRTAEQPRSAREPSCAGRPRWRCGCPDSRRGAGRTDPWGQRHSRSTNHYLEMNKDGRL